MTANFKARIDCHILELSRQEMNTITNPADKKNQTSDGAKIGVYETRLLKLNQRYPLDYLSADLLNKPDEMRLQSIFKNVTMNIVNEIRDKRRRPKLSDFLKLY